MADAYKTGKRTSLSADDPSTAAAAKGFGGVYLGPATDMLTGGSPPQPARSNSQKKKDRRESKAEEKLKGGCLKVW